MSDLVTAKDYPPELKTKAYELFLNTANGVTEIALDLGVDQKVVASWIRNGKWRERKQELEMELFKDAEEKYRALIRDHRVPTVERHLRIAEKLEKSIEQVIEVESSGGTPSSMVLKRMAEALASATGVSARAAAITERPFDVSESDAKKGGKVPLVMIGINAKRPEDSIDVEVRDA